MGASRRAGSAASCRSVGGERTSVWTSRYTTTVSVPSRILKVLYEGESSTQNQMDPHFSCGRATTSRRHGIRDIVLRHRRRLAVRRTCTAVHEAVLRRRDRYLCVACRPHTRPQRFSPRRRELARAPQTHHTHRKPRHPTLASRSKRECAPLQHAAHVTQAMSSFTSTHHVASNAHKAPRNAPGTLSRPSRAHSNAPIPAQ